MEPLRLPESRNMRLTLQHHLLRHIINLRPRSIIHHGVGEHQIHVPLKFRRIRYPAILHPRLDRLEVHRSLDDIVVVWGFGFFDGIVENVAVTVLGDRTVKHADDVLELFGDDGCFGVRAFAALFDCLTWA